MLFMSSFFFFFATSIAFWFSVTISLIETLFRAERGLLINTGAKFGFLHKTTDKDSAYVCTEREKPDKEFIICHIQQGLDIYIQWL